MNHDFLRPPKQIILDAKTVLGQGYWPNPIDENDPWWESGESPRYYTWRVSFTMPKSQVHGYPYSQTPYRYNCLDVNKNDFVVDGSNGKIYKVSEVENKTNDTVDVILEDVYRIMTFKSINGESTPGNHYYLCFSVNEDYNSPIDTMNGSSLINLRALLNIQPYLDNIKFTNNLIITSPETFDIDDVISIDGDSYKKANSTSFTHIIGKVVGTTSVENEYIIEPSVPLSTIEDIFGNKGDIIYMNDDGNKTLIPTKKPLYLKLENSISNIAKSRPLSNPYIPQGCSIDINGSLLEFSATSTTTLDEFVTLVNQTSDSDNLGIVANIQKPEYSIKTDKSKLESGLIGIVNLPCEIEINGNPITISSTDFGQKKYNTSVAIGRDIEKDINQADVENIRASYDNARSELIITHLEGEDINIANISGGTFASDGGSSGTGLRETNSAPDDINIVKMVKNNGGEISIREISGNFFFNSGITGADNGVLAKGLYYGSTIRTSTNYVVNDENEMSNLSPLIGDGVHILDQGNGEWIEKKYTESGWVTIATQDSARTDADTLTKNITFEDNGNIILGNLSSNSRVTNISIIIKNSFNEDVGIMVGDNESKDSLVGENDVDMTEVATFNIVPSIVYQEETEISITFNNDGVLTEGSLQVVLSYQ